ncbi:hypothetical protein GH714_021856 [Hevea brasiliensis]|uniref:Non-haem dioxygenase N-terminal domain-containing protein n=1 Tax=Hevea brasiliensis TaxID=3981 RepID=A0A6A6NIC4_HEVBR|nr:hypothetical protein GH714_021856 [Hevea brasiliensis]
MAIAKPLLSDLASTVNYVPSNYIRPSSDRPNFSEVQTSDGFIPLFDLQGLDGPDRFSLIQDIGKACQDYGFFQVDIIFLTLCGLLLLLYYYYIIIIYHYGRTVTQHLHVLYKFLDDKVKNHGISKKLIDEMLRVSKEFFHLPESERLKNYSEDPMKTTRLSTSFNVKTEKIQLERFLETPCHPLEDYIQDGPATLHLSGNSNDRYKSVLHRAVVNSMEERISIPTFYCPSPDAVMGPAPPLADHHLHPPIYSNFTYSEYYKLLEPWPCY